MNEPSEEQMVPIRIIQEGHNAIINAWAGSGKSTTVLSAAKIDNTKKFIQITYNSALRKEIQAKVEELNIPNIEIHTYHSIAVTKYLTSAYNDMEMHRILYEDIPPKTPISEFQVLVIDETQDMSPLYYRLILKFIRDHNRKIQLMILGDYMQGLYEFKGADIRFLTEAQEIWATHPLLKSPVFHKCTLNMSYRITNQMADFVNEVMLGETRIQACREGPTVFYARKRSQTIYTMIVYMIKELLAEPNNLPSDIFILGASVKGQNNQIRRIENLLVSADIPCHVPTMETDKIDDKVIRGKVVFSTFHAVKGRQRKYVFVIGFDESYMTYFAKTLIKTECPSTLYVAATRATHRLFVFEKEDNPTDKRLPFLKKSHHDMIRAPYVDFQGYPQTIMYDHVSNTKGDEPPVIVNHTTPTDLIQFIKEEILIKVIPILQRIFVKISQPENEEEIQIPTTIETAEGFHEDVSDLNGIAIPAMFYDYIESLHCREEAEPTNNLYMIIRQNMANIKEGQHGYLREIVKQLNPNCETVGDYLYMTNVYMAIQEKLYYKVKQITRYDWLEDGILAKCKLRLLNVLGEECEREKPEIENTIISYDKDEDHGEIDRILEPHFGKTRKIRFYARVDLLTKYTLWELKCTTELSYEHKIQCVIYAWLYKVQNPGTQITTKLFNIRSGEIYRLEGTMEEWTDIMVELLKGKYGEQIVKPDGDFLKDCHDSIKSLYNI
jgi:hypothetical protein